MFLLCAALGDRDEVISGVRHTQTDGGRGCLDMPAQWHHSSSS